MCCCQHIVSISCSSIKNLFSKIKSLTVEPLVFAYLIAWVLQTTLTTNLIYDKVCEQSDDAKEVCGDGPTSSGHKQDKVQVIVSQYNMYLNIIQTLPSIIFVLFMGSWSDLNGRKIPLIMPLLGSMVSTLICLINAYIWWLHPSHILFSGIPRAFSGGSKSFMMAVYSYIIDISSAEHRTTRIAFVDSMFIVAPPFALYLSDALYKAIGYVGVYSVSSIILFLSTLYIIFCLKETKGPFAHEEYTDRESLKDQECCSVENIQESKKYSNFFNTDHFKKTVSIVITRRRNKANILLLMFLICLMNFRTAIFGLDYLYAKKKFSWNYSQFIEWNIVYFLCLAFGESIVLPILSSYLHTEEYILGVMGSISRIACSVIQSFSYIWWHFYVAASVGFLAEITSSVTRAKISKLSISEDIGKTFSMLASWESIVPLIASPIYTFTYNATIDVFPGAIFLLTAVIFIVVGVTLLSLYFRDLMRSTINFEEIGEPSRPSTSSMVNP